MPNIKHWFNGLGYLHEFKFDDGELQYSASYVPCTQYEAAMPKSKVGERISTEQDWVPASGARYVPNTGVTIRMVGDHQVLVNTGYSGSNEAGPGATWLETPFQYTYKRTRTAVCSCSTPYLVGHPVLGTSCTPLHPAALNSSS